MEIYIPVLSKKFKATTQANTETSSYGEWRNSWKMKWDLENNLPTPELNKSLKSWVLNQRVSSSSREIFISQESEDVNIFIILDFIDNIHSSQAVRGKKKKRQWFF